MDKKSFLGFLLIAVVIILLPKYYEFVNPNYGKQATAETTTIISDTTNVITAAPIVEPQKTAINQSIPETQVVNTIEEKHYNIETDLYKMVLSNKAGGSIKSFKLKEHFIIKNSDTTLVELINKNKETNLLLDFISVNSGLPQIIINNFELQNQNQNDFSLHGHESLSMKFLFNYKGKAITKTFTFYGDKYYFNLENDLSKIASDIAAGTFNLNWNGGISYTEKDMTDANRYAMAFAHTDPDETEKFKQKKAKAVSTEFKGNTNWTAIRSKYFAVAMIPEKAAEGYKLSGYGINRKVNENDKKETLFKYFGMNLAFPKYEINSTKIYIGPLSKDLLTEADEKLDNIMSFGAAIIKPISKLVLWLFKYLYKIIPNYGFVLIIFSILIKILLHPLTVKSTQSMKAMHNLQPLINDLKEKYKDDAQKLNQATMKLYGEHGVNPMGGCLPLLFQMPILFALFTVFRTTIELRHAPFIFWITDLSAPDAMFHLPFTIPFYGEYVNFLPMVMVVSQIFMQKMSGQTQTAQQKQMALMMPVMFFFIFNNFPSGLVLYYTLFNILTIVQQQYFTPDPKPKVKKAKSGKSRLERMRELQQKRKNFK